MLTNLDYFAYAASCPEPLIDPQYHLVVQRTVIPPTTTATNALCAAHDAIVGHITAIDTLLNHDGHAPDSTAVVDHIKAIIGELAVPGINYSPLCQYFNVHNMNYSLFVKKSHAEQIALLQYILPLYIRDRHRLYQAHGYSPVVLQVMCDNYSHKRKGSYGANKIAAQLETLGIPDLVKQPTADFNCNTYFLLADKSGNSPGSTASP